MVGRGLQLRARRLRRFALLGAGVWFLCGAPTDIGPLSGGSQSPGADPVPAASQASLIGAIGDWGSGADRQQGAEAGHGVQDAGSEGLPSVDGEGHGPRIRDVFFVLILILLSGKLLGEMVERRGQPAVLGELLAGVILGGSVLGVIPDQGTEMYEIIHVFAEIGVSILLFEIGLETDLKEMFSVGRTASAVALIGVAVPFALGFLYWYLANPTIGVHPEGISFAVVSVFVGATLTATSVGITARVLSDLERMHTAEARIIIGAAVIDDVLGIVILAVVAGLASGAAVGLFAISRIFLFAVGFLVLAVIIGNRFAPVLFDAVDRMRVRGVLLVTAFCFALGIAALADWAGSAMIIGAFAAGLVLSSTNQFDSVVEKIEPVADVFTPIFFVAVGAPVNVHLFIPGSADFDLAVLVVGLILTAIAIVGKLVAGLAVRKAEVSRIVVGVGMVPRGEVGLIFASIGLSAGILSGAVYSAILIMVMLSTFIVPPVLKVLFAAQPNPPAPSIDELEDTHF
ncbi:MAG: cation:proton antiporter [Candidatus Palauibacterales bacterium]|nr:cation:proton antiporter [Candidatus Palauibacterales bacterium]